MEGSNYKRLAVAAACGDEKIGKRFYQPINALAERIGLRGAFDLPAWLERRQNESRGGALDTHLVARQLLAKAAARLGGTAVLASRLDVSERVVKLYIEGQEPVPDSLVLKVIDCILEGLPEPKH